MTKFLHIADIHLGIRRYRSDERTHDFFLAWKDCLEKYAIAEKVSFVLIAGDFFDVRRVEPQAMNQAIAGLELLRDAGIPVLVIEGNHDQHEATSRFSWLRSLSKWGFLKLLEPGHIDGRPVYSPWDENRREGSFIDLDDVRVFGSSWYGSTGTQMLPRLVEELLPHRSPHQFNILMLHTDVEGQLNRPIPAVSVEKLSELKAVTDYLALGHTHKNFEIDGSVIFNPGSLEACNVEEFDYRRGAYLVDIVAGKPVARLVEDYYSTAAHRLQLDVSAEMTPEVVAEALYATLERELPKAGNEVERPAPVLDIVLRGTLGFDSSLLEVNRLRDDIRKKFDPLLVLVRNRALPREYSLATGLSQHISRSERERRVIEEIVSRDARFSGRAVEMTNLVLEAKRMALNDEDGWRIADLIAHQRAAIYPPSAG